MILLEMACELGLNPKKTSYSKGGEYHCACPSCGDGIDRFMFWPQANRYWCRRCDVSGDGIQFCLDFMGMSFCEAYEKLNHYCPSNNDHNYQFSKKDDFEIVVKPSKIWQEKALLFVEWSRKQLLKSSKAMKELVQRGLNENTINEFNLGYCINEFSTFNKDLSRNRENWGLCPEYKDNGQIKTLWLPCGIVIPTMSDNNDIIKLKIRREQWYKEDHLPKYVEVCGSMLSLSVYGNKQHPVLIVVESEFDAILIQQEAKDLCFCIALGGVTKKPDLECDHLLKETKVILLSLDNDEAGKNAALWWRTTYPNLRFWPVPIGKSPGDAHKDHGINLRKWILEGIRFYSKSDTPYENSINEVINYE